MMSVEELKKRFVGRSEIYEGSSSSFRLKEEAYREEGAWDYYLFLKRKYREEFTDYRGWVDEMLVNKVSGLVIDTLLLRRAQGVKVEIPSKDAIESGVLEYRKGGANEGITLKSFYSEKPVPYKESMQWIYQHLEVKGVLPSECPDAGTWGYYQLLLNDPEARADFYKTVYPKVARELLSYDEMKEDDKRQRFMVIDRLIDEMHGVKVDNGPEEE